MNTKSKLLLPALRGNMGDWVYYTCLMPIQELATRVEYAQDIHGDKALSKLIQRSLEGKRSEQIANYLEKTSERFFNSLVLATYEGHPEWLEVGNFQSTSDLAVVDVIGEQGLDTLGFLSLSGKEKIFAIDGQHRLAGIKRAIADRFDFGRERISVIFVAHSEKQRERTRRLFTTLNKTAKAVKKWHVIALDEDDTMAITARRMVETSDWFASPKILIEASDNLPSTNRVALTTISNLYDVLKQIFKHRIGKTTDTSLRFFRPSDKELEKFHGYAMKFFEALAQSFPAIGELFSSTSPARVTQRFRGENGGHALFRPVGLNAFTTVAIAFAKHHEVTLPEAVRQLAVLPTDLSARPYRGVVWDADRKKMVVTGKKVLVDLLAYMVGLPTDLEKLRLAYAKATGSDVTLRLPNKVLTDLS